MTEVTSLSESVGPSSAAIRNWGPWFQVFIVSDDFDNSGDGSHSAALYKYICSFGDTCSTAALSLGFPKAVGSSIAADAGTLQPAPRTHSTSSSSRGGRTRTSWPEGC